MGFQTNAAKAAKNTRRNSGNKRNAKTAKAASHAPGQSLEMRFTEMTMEDGEVCGGQTLGTSNIFRWVDSDDGPRWQPMTRHDIECRAALWLEECAPDKADPKTATSCAKWYGMKLSALGRTVPQPDPKRSLVPMKNAVLEILPDGRIAAHRPDPSFGTLGCAQAFVNEEALATGEYQIPPLDPESMFARYIHATLPNDDVRRYAQKALATILVTACYEKVIWLYGGGENGKSVLLALLENIFPTATHSTFLNNVENRFGLAPLLGKRLVLVPEMPPALTPKIQLLLKALSSRDTVEGEKKHADPYSFKPQAVWVMSSNGLPAVREHTHGWDRRILILPFRQKVRKEDKIQDLGKILVNNPVEFTHFINWLLEGAKHLVLDKGLTDPEDAPQAVRDLIHEQKLTTDNVYNFVDSVELQRDTRSWFRKFDVYDHYVGWCRENNYAPLASRNFWTRLTEQMDLTDADFARKRWPYNGQQEQVCRLRAEAGWNGNSMY